MCCGLWGHKESDTTEQLNLTEAVSLIAVAVPNVISFLGPTIQAQQLVWSKSYIHITFTCHGQMYILNILQNTCAVSDYRPQFNLKGI